MLILIFLFLIFTPVHAGAGNTVAIAINADSIYAQTSPKPSAPAVLVEKAKKDLSVRANIPIAAIQLRASERQTWPNGCLGLAQPDEICTQAMVPGWRLVLTHQDKTWVYRTNQSGRVLRLEPTVD